MLHLVWQEDDEVGMKIDAQGVMETGSGQLSAEAAEFVPTHDPASLPKYMFNCYPFVTEPGGHKRSVPQ